jgi:hypothetical protein
MRTCLKTGVVTFCLFCLGACALLAPRRSEPLKIFPAALGEHTVEQQLLIRWKGGERGIDAVLETSDGYLHLVLMALGMRILSLEYDGVRLIEERHVPQAPESVRILNDLLTVAAPKEVLQDALPNGWNLSEEFLSSVDHEGRVSLAATRRIVVDGATLIEVHYGGCLPTDPWRCEVTLKNHAEGYELVLNSHEI